MWTKKVFIGNILDEYVHPIKLGNTTEKHSTNNDRNTYSHTCSLHICCRGSHWQVFREQKTN